MNLSDAILARTRQQQTLSFTGVYRRMSGSFAVVDALGSTGLLIPSAAQVPPVSNDVVQVELRNGQYVMLGPVKPHPTRGTVTVVGSPLVTVSTADGLFSLPFMSAYSPSVNDDVAIEWTGEGGLVKGRVSTTPPPPTPEPPPAEPSREYHPSPFLASAAGYHKGGVYNGNWFPNYGTNQTAAAWYGMTVADSIPDDATITLARVFLSERQAQFGGPAVQVIEGTGPQARVPVGAATALPARSGWVAIPFEVVDLLKVAGRGVSIIGATNPSGLSIYNKLSDDPQSFALDLAWRTA